MRMQEPLSTLSNAFYGVAGVLVIMDALANGATLGHVYVSLSAFWLMVGSAWYHATFKNPGQSYDEMAMYTLLGSLIGVGTVALGSTGATGVAIWILAVLMGTFLWPILNSFVVVPLMTVIVILLVIANAGIGKGLVLLSIFLLSVMIRQIGAKYHGSLMGDIFHGMWHLGTASAMFLCFMYLQ
jgi:hypothetical protein